MSKTMTPEQAHVIVVEDNPDNLLIIMKLLRLAGVERLNWRTTGKEVVAFVKAMTPVESSRRPDLILLDIDLPEEDGYEVLAELRSDERLRHTRVVAVTQHNSSSDLDQAREFGFDGFIGKPINPKHFPDQIRRILAGEQIWEL